MFFRPLLAGALVALVAGALPGHAAGYPFLGNWDCGVATFSFSPTVYNNGSEDMPIQEVQEGTDNSWTLLFADDYFITLSGITDTEMGWLSSSGESLECTRAE